MVPVHFVRYEDLITSPAEIYGDLFRFLLDLDDIEGTNVQQRIKCVISGGVQTYRLKQTTG
jgi:hypothetical protein